MKKDNRERCAYCGSSAIHGAFICRNCYEKLMLIRKIKAIVLRIKSEEEKRDSQGISHADQKIQNPD